MDKQLYQYHPTVGYHFIPHLKSRLEHEGGGYLVRTNGTGFRSDHEFSENLNDKKRVLLFGDSFTAGMGVSNKHCYSAVLETLVPNLEVYNFAMPGTGTDQHYLIYREFAKTIECDLIIIAVQVENIRRVAARHRLWQNADGSDILLPKPYFNLEDNGTLTLHNIPVPKNPIRVEDLPEEERGFVDQGGRMLWLRNIINKMGGRVKEIAQQVSHYQPLPEYDNPDGREWLLLKTLLHEWITQFQKPVIVFPIPLYQYIEETASPSGIVARFDELKTLKNTTLINPLPLYYKLPKTERRAFRFENDLHPTIAHHRFLAETLSDTIVSTLNLKEEGASVK